MTDIAAHYDHLAARHGATPQAVDAPNQTALDIRYQALGNVADMNDKTVLEVGCGYGGLGAYLTNRYPAIRYTGIDISTRLLDVGHQTFPELNLRPGDLMTLGRQTHFDIVLAQGIFYLLQPDGHLPLIRRMWQICREAVAFTAITTWRPSKGGEHRIHPARTVDLLRSFTPFVVMRHDYHPGDGMFALYRKAQ